MSVEEGWVYLASIDIFDGPGVVGITVGDREIALYRLADGEICATSNICTHGQAYLSEGWMTDEGCIECPLHGGAFDIKTGAGMGPPIDEDLQTYEVRVLEGEIHCRFS